MTFTDIFKGLLPEQKEEAVQAERKRRLPENPEEYVVLPVAAPIFSKMAIHGSKPVDFQLGWIIGTPGVEELKDGTHSRMALSLPFPTESVAEDFCYALNRARLTRQLADMTKSVCSTLPKTGIEAAKEVVREINLANS
jgi:hypothetical protein